MPKVLTLIALLAMPFSLGGCIFAAGAGAGAVIADEANENDGEFDPLEEVINDDK